MQKFHFMPRKTKKTEPQIVTTYNTDALTQVVVDALQEIKGHDITEIRFSSSVEQPLFDAFILCSATSTTQADALCTNVMRRVYEKLHIEPAHFEGKDQAQWILIDYFDIVVHIFMEEKRRFYDVEGLWNDADIRIYKEAIMMNTNN